MIAGPQPPLLTAQPALESNGYFSRRRTGRDGGEPTWEIAYLFPVQGNWTERDYFNLERIGLDWVRAELSNGHLEMLPMPTEIHQDIIGFLWSLLHAFITPRKLGKVLFSGLRVRLQNGDDPKYREPDVAFMKAENAQRRHNEFWEGADLAMEVVSGDAKEHERDYVIKVQEYAEAGISEYWIIDPGEMRVRVLKLVNGAYQVHADFGPGTIATSVLLPGFAVPVSDIFASEEA